MKKNLAKDASLWNGIVPMIIVLMTAIAFLPILKNHFVSWDDDMNFLLNPYYRGVHWDTLAWAFTRSCRVGGLYIPLSWLTSALDYQLWGMNPAGYHAVNLVIHICTALLLYATLRLLLEHDSSTRTHRTLIAAGVGTLFFSIHPLRVESVAWATERRDVLSGFFFLGTLYSYLRYEALPSANPKKRSWYRTAFISYMFALLSKPIVMTLPVLLTLLDLYPLKRSAWKEKWPFYALALSAALGVLYTQKLFGATVSLEHLGFLERLALLFYGSAFYLYKTLWPLKLSPLYPIGSAVHLNDAVYSLSIAAVLGWSIFLYQVRIKWPALLTASAFYITCLLPVSGLFQNGPQIAADRYSYLPCMAWAVLVGILWSHLKKSWLRNTATALILAGLMGLTWKQCTVWHDSTTLWTYVLERYPDSVVALTNLGNERQYEGRLDEAIPLYHHALEINPTYAMAQSNWGAALHKEGKWQEAVPHFEEALRLNPHDSLAQESLGMIFAGQGKLDEAVSHLEAALAINPRLATAHHNLAVIFMSQGKTQEAEKQLALAGQYP